MESNAPPGKGWHIALWFAQVLLAIGFLAGGWGKMVWPMQQINAQVPWAPAVPEYLMRFIGVSEVLGAIGLILPALTRIRPGLTIFSATRHLERIADHATNIAEDVIYLVEGEIVKHRPEAIGHE